MNRNPCVPLISSTTLLVAIAAQTPAGSVEPQRSPEVTLQSLQSLTTETVYRRQPLNPAAADAAAPANGTAADQPFASIRDARFERDGRLVDLLVEAPADAPKVPAVRRILPAKDVQWDAATKRWLLGEPNLKVEGLVEAPVAAPAAAPIPRKKDQPVLASELMLAAVIAFPGAPAKEPAVEASASKTAQPNAELWFVPTRKALSFAVIPHGKKHLPLPWGLLRVVDHGPGLGLQVETSAGMLEGAPSCTKPGEPPDSSLRKNCYRYYAVPTPGWEGQPDDAGKQKRDKGTSKSDGR